MPTPIPINHAQEVEAYSIHMDSKTIQLYIRSPPPKIRLLSDGMENAKDYPL